MNPDAASETTLHDLMRRIARRRGLLITVAMLVFGGVAIWTFTATPRYRSQALLRIEAKPGSSSGLLDQVQSVPGLSFAGLGRDEIETDIGVLRSRRILDAVIDSLVLNVRLTSPAGNRNRFVRLRQVEGTDVRATLSFARNSGDRYALKATQWKGPAASLPTTVGPGDTIRVGRVLITLADSLRNSTVARFELVVMPHFQARDLVEKRLDVRRTESGSRLVEVNLEDEDRVLAAAVVDRMVNEFVGYSLRSEKTDAGSQVEELRRQVDAQKPRLAQAEERLRAYQLSSRLLLPEEQATQQVKRIATLNSQLDVLTVERASLSRLLVIIERRAEGGRNAAAYRQLATFPTLISNRAIQDLLESLIALENKRSELGVRRSDGNDELRQHSTRIGEIEQQLYRVGVQYLESLDQQIATAGAQVTTLSDTLQTLPDKEMQFVRLVRDRTIYNEGYIQLLKQLRLAELQDALRLERIRVVDAPIVADQDNPVYPRPAVQLLLGALLAGLIALAVGLAAEILAEKRS